MRLGVALVLAIVGCSTNEASNAPCACDDAAIDSALETSSDAARDACVPTTCAAMGAPCGRYDDGCGSALDCGTCAKNATPIATDVASIDLGEVFVDQARIAPVLLTNGSGSSVVVTGAKTFGDDLTVLFEPTIPTPPALPITLGAGSVTWLVVRFAPKKGESIAGALSVTTSAGSFALPVAASSKPLADFADPTTFGAKGDGATDDTEAFRKAAATGKILRISSPPGGAFYELTKTIHVVGAGVVGSDADKPTMKMIGADGLGITAPDHEGHVMFWMDDWPGATTAIFTGLHLDGGWDGATAVQEWDHLIQVRHSKNVIVENDVLENPMGDCLEIGGEGLAPSSDVTMRGNVCRNPWRDTFSDIASSGDVRVVANVLEKPNGFFPADGAGAYYQTNIDFEPNPSTAGFLDYVNGAVVAFNWIVSHRVHAQPGGNGVGFCHQGGLPAGEPPNGVIDVHDNGGDAPFGFLSFPCPDPWTAMTAARNPNPRGCLAAGGAVDCP